MFPIPKEVIVSIGGVSYKKHVILADVNIPYKFTLDRTKNNLIFSINADEFSDQSFHSVILNLDTESVFTVPGIRNGFASAIDQSSGQVFLGGSEGIFYYNQDEKDISKPALISGIDIFDMYYRNDLYFVDTSTQTLHKIKDGKKRTVSELKGHLVHHFVIDDNDDMFFINPAGLFVKTQGSSSAMLLENGEIHFRGAAVDTFGAPHFIAHDGIYAIDKLSQRIENVLPIENGYGLAFDKNNNIIYSNERSVIKLIHYY